MSIQAKSQSTTADTIVVSQDDYVYGRTENRDYSKHPIWSRHALQRYDERTPSGSVSPEKTWTDGISVQYALPYFTTKEGQFPQEVRVYEHDNCHSIAIRLNEHIGTVLLLELVTDSAVRSYIHTLCDLHKQGKLQHSSTMYGESPTRVEKINARSNQ